MRNFGARPAAGATFADIEELVAEEAPESQHLEFKEYLPAPKEQIQNPWYRGASEVGDRARDAIVQEVVAFANAYGGDLIIGIRESDDHPKRASGVTPVPRCHDLAARIRHLARDCVEPQLPQIEVVGITNGQSDEGVVLVRVPQSRLRPHREVQHRHAYFRRDDRSEKMTMREIQDLTLLRERSSAAVEQRFRELALTFNRADTRSDGRGGHNSIRVCCVPTTLGLLNEDAVRSAQLRPTDGHYPATVGHRRVTLEGPSAPMDQRPVVRGTRWSFNSGGYLFLREIHHDGCYWAVNSESYASPDDTRIRATWLGWETANALLTIDRIRRVGGNGDLEYAMEVEVIGSPGPPTILPLGASGNIPDFRPLCLEDPKTSFPRLAVRARKDFPELVGIVLRDAYNAAGWDLPGEWSIELPDVLG